MPFNNNNNDPTGIKAKLAMTGGAADFDNFIDALSAGIEMLQQKGAASLTAGSASTSQDTLNKLSGDLSKHLVDQLDKVLKDKRFALGSNAPESVIKDLDEKIKKLLEASNSLGAYGNSRIRNASDVNDVRVGANILERIKRIDSLIERQNRLNGAAGGGTGGAGGGGLNGRGNGPGNGGNPAGAGLMTIEEIRELGANARLHRISRLSGVSLSDSNAPSRASLRQSKQQMEAALKEVIKDPSLTVGQKEEYMGAVNAADAKIKAALKNQSQQLDNTFQGVMRFMSAFAVMQTASKIMLTDKFQYGTVPALNAFGKTGEVGSALSGALMSKEQYNLGINQSAVGMGTGLMMLPGVPMKLLGGLVAGAGLTGKADNTWNAIGGSWFGEKLGMVNDNTVFQNKLAEMAFDPQRIIETGRRAQKASIGLTDFEGSKGSDFSGQMYGNDIAKKSISGNSLADYVLKRRVDGFSAYRYGYNSNDILDLMGQMQSKTGPMSRDAMVNSTTNAIFESRGRATTAEQYMGNLAAIKSMGLKNNSDEVLKRYYAAASDEKGNLNQYTSDVIVPALIQVSQSLQLKSLATSADKMSQQVSMMYADFNRNSDTNYGAYMSKHPEALTQSVNNAVQGAESMMTDPKGLAMLQRYGINPVDVLSGKLSPLEVLRKTSEGALSAAERGTGIVLGKSDFNADGTPTDSGASRFATIRRALMVQQQSAPGLDIANAMYVAYQQATGQKQMTKEEFNKKFNLTNDVADTNNTNIANSSAAAVEASTKKQVDAMNIVANQLYPDVIRMQNLLNTYIADGTLFKSAEQGINNIIKAIQDAIRGGGGGRSVEGNGNVNNGDGNANANPGQRTVVPATLIGGRNATASSTAAAMKGLDTRDNLIGSLKDAPDELTHDKAKDATLRKLGFIGESPEGNKLLRKQVQNVNSFLNKSINAKDSETGKTYETLLKDIVSGKLRGDKADSTMLKILGSSSSLSPMLADYTSVQPSKRTDGYNGLMANAVLDVANRGRRGASEAQKGLDANSALTPKKDAPQGLSAPGEAKQGFKQLITDIVTRGKNDPRITQVDKVKSEMLTTEELAKLKQSDIYSQNTKLFDETIAKIEKQLANKNLTQEQRADLENKKLITQDLAKQDKYLPYSSKKANREALAIGNMKDITGDGVFDLEAIMKDKNGNRYAGIGGTTGLPTDVVKKYFNFDDGTANGGNKGNKGKPAPANNKGNGNNAPSKPSKQAPPSTTAKPSAQKHVSPPPKTPVKPTKPQTPPGKKTTTPTTTNKADRDTHKPPTVRLSGIQTPIINDASTVPAYKPIPKNTMDSPLAQTNDSTTISRTGPNEAIIHIRADLTPDELKKKVLSSVNSATVKSHGGGANTAGMRIV